MNGAPPFARAIYRGAGKKGAVADPELWHLHAEGGTEEEVTAFLAALVGLLKARTVVECGTLNGRTSEALARATDAHRGHYIGIEQDPRRADRTRERLYCDALAAPDTVRCEDDLHAEFSERPDLVFIDSGDNGHRLKVLARFLLMRVPCIALHDAAPWYGYHAQAEHLARAAGYSPCYFRTPQGLFLFVRPAEEDDTMTAKKAGAKAGRKKAASAPAPRAACPVCGARAPSRVSGDERIIDVHATGNNKCSGSGARIAA